MIKNTLIITCISLLASLFGFIAQIFFFKEFGTSVEMDLYFLALSIPAAVSGVAPILISSIVIPYFADCSASNISIREKIYSVFIYIIILAVAISICGGTLSYFNIKVALFEKNETLISTTQILTIYLWTATALSVASSFLAALINYHNKFFHAAWPTILPPVLMVIFVIILNEDLGVTRISAGYLAASILQFAILFTRARVYIVRPQPIDNYFSDIKILSRRIPVILISLLPFSAIAPITYFFASSLPEGSISSLGYGQSFAGFLSIATSMGAAIVGFPGLAVAHAKGDVNSELKKFELTLTLVLIVSIFLASAITSLASPIVNLIYVGKDISNTSADKLVHLIPWYVISAIFISGINLLRSLAYARNEQRFIAIGGAAMIAVFVMLAGPLMTKFSTTGMAVDVAISFCVFFFSIILYYRFKEPMIFGIEFYKSMSYTILTAFISAGMTTSLAHIFISTEISIYKLLLIGFFYSTLFYLVSSKVFRIREIVAIEIAIIKFCKKI